MLEKLFFFENVYTFLNYHRWGVVPTFPSMSEEKLTVEWLPGKIIRRLRQQLVVTNVWWTNMWKTGDTARTAVLYGHYVPISGQADSREHVP